MMLKETKLCCGACGIQGAFYKKKTGQAFGATRNYLMGIQDV
jgi:hypothetical protein